MINKKIQKQIVSTFKKETTNAKKIAKKYGVSRRDVMWFLETEGLKSYSMGSYA